jgi:hypothetical protein
MLALLSAVLSLAASPAYPNNAPKIAHQSRNEQLGEKMKPKQKNGIQIPEQQSSDVSHGSSQEFPQVCEPSSTGAATGGALGGSHSPSARSQSLHSVGADVGTGATGGTGVSDGFRYSSYWARIRSFCPVVKRTRHRVSAAYDMKLSTGSSPGKAGQVSKLSPVQHEFEHVDRPPVLAGVSSTASPLLGSHPPE